ncbi:MAG: alpha/beta hydrolase [Oscillatoriales cyanobacterium SM2_2_1]|nr:alpha/beta hydrolase [Oscillatoriales cyanobacterium SM2_2_1]
MPYISLADANHCYTLTPQRDSQITMVFVHGWLLSQAYWQPLIELLSPHVQCLSYDLRGFGRSGLGERQDFSPRGYADDLGELLGQLRGQIGQRVWLVGHSLGGTIALWSAYRLSEHIAGVLCLNAGGGIYVKQDFEKFRRAGQVLVRLRPSWLSRISWLYESFGRDSTHIPLGRDWGRQRLVDFVSARREAAQQTLLQFTTAEEVHQLPQIVAQLEQPVYFIAGDRDQIMEPQYVRYLASFHPASRAGSCLVVELPQCGHMGMLEQTAAVKSQLMNWVLYNQEDQEAITLLQT